MLPALNHTELHVDLAAGTLHGRWSAARRAVGRDSGQGHRAEDEHDAHTRARGGEKTEKTKRTERKTEGSCYKGCVGKEAETWAGSAPTYANRRPSRRLISTCFPHARAPWGFPRLSSAPELHVALPASELHVALGGLSNPCLWPHPASHHPAIYPSGSPSMPVSTALRS
jgi:hypothetical protein